MHRQGYEVPELSQKATKAHAKALLDVLNFHWPLVKAMSLARQVHTEENPDNFLEDLGDYVDKERMAIALGYPRNWEMTLWNTIYRRYLALQPAPVAPQGTPVQTVPLAPQGTPVQPVPPGTDAPATTVDTSGTALVPQSWAQATLDSGGTDDSEALNRSNLGPHHVDPDPSLQGPGADQID